MKFLYDNFDLLFDEAGSVDAFKKLILDMAVRGKLVPQDPNDELSNFVLKKNTKNYLDLKFKIKPTTIDEKEKPYSLPNSWVWVRIGEVLLDIVGGGTPSKSNAHYWNGGINWASVKDLTNEVYLNSTKDQISEVGLTKSSSKLIPKGNIIICTRMGLGKININAIDVAINQDLKALFLQPAVDLLFFYYLYKVMRIEGKGTTVKGITQEALLKSIIPLPPLNEQKRIVQKIDEIYEMIPQLEEAFEKRTKCNRQLNRTSLYRLTEAKSREEFVGSMQFVTNNFSSLYDNIENVKELRQTILTLAVQGKLVPQDPSDEPASVLLEKIQKEKDRLIKEGVLKKYKPLPPIKENEIPFSLPDGWKWVRLKEIGYTQTGTTPSTTIKEYFNGPIPFIKPADISDKRIEYNNESLTDLGLQKGRLIKKDSAMMVCIGGSIGKSFYTTEDVSCNQQINAITGYLGIDGRFINYFISAKYFQDEVLKKATGSATPIINKEKWDNIVFPLPPNSEQNRIVKKINELMALCEELESIITDCIGVSNQLLDSAIFETFVNVP